MPLAGGACGTSDGDAASSSTHAAAAAAAEASGAAATPSPSNDHAGARFPAQGRSFSARAPQHRGDAGHAPSPRVLGACSGRKCATETCANSKQRCQRCGGCDALPAPATRHVLERLVVDALRHRAQLGVVARLRQVRRPVSAAPRKRQRGVPWPKHPPRWRSAARAPSWAAPGSPLRADGAHNWRRHRPGAVPSLAARVPSRPASRRAAAGRVSPPRARRRVAPGTMSSEGDGSDKPAPTAPGAEAAGGAKPIAEALQRLVMTSGASRRHTAPLARRCGARRAPGFAPRARASARSRGFAPDPSPRHVGRRLDALQRRHAFWETQPVVQFGEADAAEARVRRAFKRAARRSLRAAAHAGARGADRPAHDGGASAARAVPPPREARPWVAVLRACARSLTAAARALRGAASSGARATCRTTAWPRRCTSC